MTIQPDTHHATTTARVGEAPSDTALPADDLALLRMRGDALAAIGAALGLTPEEITAAESLDRLEVELTRDPTWLTTLDEQHVTTWFAAFGGDLEIDLRLAGLDSQSSAPVAVLRAGRDPAGALARFITDAEATATAQGNELAVDVRLSVAKTSAVAAAAVLLGGRIEYFGTPEMRARTTVAVFYSAAACARLLSFSAILDWERLGLARADGRAFVVVCDRAGYLAGFALEIVGACEAEPIRWLEVSRAAWRQFQERAEHTRTLRAEESQWAEAPHVLTPAHLRVEPRAAGLEPLADALEATRAALAAAYLASSVHTAENGDLALRFGGARPPTCHIPRRTNEHAGATPAAYAHHALARFAAWAYDNASADKLAIARECLARELPPGGAVSLAQVERAALPALEAAKANFSLYLRGNSDRYFSVRERALDAISTYAAGVRKTVSDLTGDVVDNVYRTVGLLVGVVVAALLQPALALPVQRLAALLYIAYLAFVVVFLLGAREQRFHLESAEVRARLDAMSELGAVERAGLRTQAAGADAHFARYLRLARLIYAALALAGALYFLLLWTPLASHLPLAPTPTATPMPRPRA
jgi:hypothetical protein